MKVEYDTTQQEFNKFREEKDLGFYRNLVVASLLLLAFCAGYSIGINDGKNSTITKVSSLTHKLNQCQKGKK